MLTQKRHYVQYMKRLLCKYYKDWFDLPALHSPQGGGGSRKANKFLLTQNKSYVQYMKYLLCKYDAVYFCERHSPYVSVQIRTDPYK